MLLYYSILATVLAASLANGQMQVKIVKKRTINSAPGKYLKGHVFKTTTEAMDPQHCMADCWEENDRCQSFNFLFLLRKCELNDATNVTNPDDFIDRPGVVYLPNPVFGRHPRPIMPRYATNYTVTDPCASNPCKNAQGCVQDLELGYRCQNCHSKYHGPKCEEHVDPCSSNPCQNGGTCISTMTRWRCDCPFPYYGTSCTLVTKHYKFDLNGSGDYPYYELSQSSKYKRFALNFWFKTAEQKTSYFIHHTPMDSEHTERLAVWRNGNTFFVELWKDYVYNFTFPLSYPVNNNHWRVVTILLRPNAELSFFLDGVMRQPPKLTKGTPHVFNLYILRPGTLRLGYFKDSDGQEHFLNGSIGNVDIKENELDYNYINGQIALKCAPGLTGRWVHLKWVGLSRLARPINCSTRAPIMGIYSRVFSTTTQMLEQQVSPPKDLTEFTMVFQVATNNYMDKTVQIACYGNEGEDCRLSVAINGNLTLGITIESTSFEVDLVPVIESQKHFFIMTWTNVGGVFQLIIDGILRSTLLGIETNGKISGRSRFAVGSIFADFFNNFNVWDKVLSDEMLYMMTAQPGDDMGNVVAWKDFEKPASIPNEEFRIYRNFQNFRVSSIQMNNYGIQFSEPLPSYIHLRSAYCCQPRSAITLTMWLSLQQLPALIFSTPWHNGADPHVALRVLSNGNVTLFLRGQNASLGKIPASPSWHFVAFSWSANTGILHSNINGVSTHISSNFALDVRYYLDRVEGSLIGDKGNGSIVGYMAQFNFWAHTGLPPPALKALSLGINGIGANGLPWASYIGHRKGNANLIQGLTTYTPDFIALKKRDQHCNDHMPSEGCVGKYRARFGMDSNQIRKWGCFCEDKLSRDLNFNYGPGDYAENGNLLEII